MQLPKRTKKEQGQIKFILIDGLGKSFIDKTVSDQELLWEFTPSQVINHGK